MEFIRFSFKISFDIGYPCVKVTGTYVCKDFRIIISLRTEKTVKIALLRKAQRFVCPKVQILGFILPDIFQVKNRL